MVHRYLHVANGTSVTITLEAAGVPGLRSIWADPLYDGPVPAGVTDDELREVRGGAWEGDALAADPMNDMRRWRQVIAAEESYDELVLWFEHDLFDQLNLIQLLSWIRSHLTGGKPVSLICIGSFPGRSSFKGLGELSPGELAPLLDTRRRVSDAEFVLAERAWRVFREPTPEPLDDLRRSDTRALPFLARALERFLQEYPSTRDGLSRTERRLLRLAADGPMVMNAVFPRMHDDEDAYYVTDLSLAELVETLSRTSPPLIAFESDRNGGNFWKGAVALTEAGREVLAGRRDRVACGFDRWLGGVHLQSAAEVWRWDDDLRRVKRL
jgi:broad specificity phosphatase PhoE